MFPSRLARQQALALATAILLSSPLAARALDIEYIKIADTSTTIPGAGGTFLSFSSPAVNGYTVAFQGAKTSYSGIFVSSSGTLSRSVDTTSFLPGTTTPFSTLNGFSLDSNQVAFGGTSASTQGIYLTNGIGGYSKVVDNTTAIPNGTGNFSSFSSPSLSSGNIAFIGNGTSQQGVYTNANTPLHAVADTSTLIPGGTGTYTTFSNAVINYSDVGFIGGGSSAQQGVYDTVQGPLRKVADKSTAMPGGGGNFPGFSNLTLTYSTASFLPGNSTAIFSGDYNNTLIKNVGTSTPIPDGTGNFISFSTPSNWGGEVAFIGNGSGPQQGFYINNGSTNYYTIVDKSTVLDGKTISAISTGSTQTDSNGNYVFTSTFTDGSTGVYVAEQQYNWAANTSGSWDSAANWSFGLKPRSVLYTYIHPDSGAVIMGPSSATVIRGLDINANNGNGIAELRLEPGAPLSVNEGTSIGDHGLLNVNGGVLYSNGIYNDGGYINLAGGQISGGQLTNNANYWGVPGTIAASGIIGNHIENNAIIQAIGTTTRFSDSINNYQEFQIINSQVQIDGAIQNFADSGSGPGRIDVRNSILQFSTGLTNDGQFNFSFGTSDVFGPVTVGPVSTLGTGQVIISGNSNVTFYDRLIHNGDTFRISPGSTAIFFGLVSGAGSFTGGGTKIFEGGYSPGNSPAAVSLDGPVTFDAANSLYIEIGGPTLGTSFDHVLVNGNLNLGGTLNVTLINGYLPSPGATFNILDFSSSTGNFDTLPTSNLNGALRTHWTTTQTPTSVSVTFQSASYDIQSGSYSQALNINGIPLVKSTTADATLTGAYSANGPLSLTAGKLVLSTPNNLIKTQSLTLSPSTTLDLTNHDLMIGNSNLATVEAQILKGFNKAGNPTDPAITSSTAANTMFLVPIDADALLGNGTPGSAIGKLFDNTPITQPHTILLKYTYFGDITLDGKVDPFDLATVAGHFGQSTPGLADIQTSWLMGDFNLDGIVNAADFALMTANLGQSLPNIFPLLLSPQSPVPEPTTLSLLLLALPTLLTPRKPRRKFCNL